MPYRTSSPASRARRRGGRRPPSAARASSSTSAPMVDGYFGDGAAGAAPRRRAAAARQLHGPDADGGPVRPVGHVRRARRRDRQQDRVADRLHDPVRRLGLRLQPDRRPVQEPGPPARGRDRRPRRDRPQGAVGRPVAGPDRRDRGRLQLPGRSTGCCSGGSTSAARPTSWSRWASTRPRSSGSTGMVAGAEFKRQVPPIAKLGPRTAGVDYLYPRRRPGSARAVTGEPAPTARRRRDAVRRRHADRQPRRRHAAGARGPPGGPAHRRRGHPASRAGCWTATRSRRGRRATTPGAAPAAPQALLAHLARRRGPRARDRCRDARRSATRARSSWPPGRPRVGASCRSRARRPCWPRSSASGVAGPRWAFEGFLPRSRPRAPRAAGADRRRRPRRRSLLRGAGAGRGDAARPRRGVRRGPAGRRLPRADQAPRDDRARARSASWRRPRPTATIPARGEFVHRGRRLARPRPAAGGRRPPRRSTAAARAEVERAGRDGRRPRRRGPAGRRRDRPAAPAALRRPTTLG